ncbi:MAG: hypothetical protein ACLU6V_05485 [Lancefieldella rimae]
MRDCLEEMKQLELEIMVDIDAFWVKARSEVIFGRRDFFEL